MAKAYLMVRVQLTDPGLRERFDRWYRDEHLPDALKAFRAEAASRYWSPAEPPIHVALYQFADLTAARHATRPEVIGPLVAEFDRNFPTGTVRSRDLLELAQDLKP